MAAKYQLTAKNIKAYQSTDNTNKKNVAAVLQKGAEITIHRIDDEWVRVIRVVTNKTKSGDATLAYIKLSENDFKKKFTYAGDIEDQNPDEDNNENIIDDPEDDLSEDEEWDRNLEGLGMADLRPILGLPPQFLPTTDPRLETKNGSTLYNEGVGRVYYEKIIKQPPLMFVMPGIPSFLSSSRTKVNDIIGKFLSDNERSTFRKLTKENGGKYYSLEYKAKEYYNYVNVMLRSAAVFLNIENKEYNGTKLGSMDWFFNVDDEKKTLPEKFKNFIGPYANSVCLYVDAGTEVSDSFSNNTTQSSLASQINSLSDQGRELNFLIGTIGSHAGLKLDAFTGQENLESNMGVMQDMINGITSKDNILTSILSKAQTVLAGGRLIFPEIWSDSSFGRSYSMKMKLVSTTGAKFDVYLKILVPAFHVMAMCLPRQSDEQAYYSPFLLRCYYKGLFHIDMGIMTDLSFTKGAEGEWTTYGIPTVAELSFSIKDLYEEMSMSKDPGRSIKGASIISNISELDYLANTCGININDMEIKRLLRYAKMVISNTFSPDVIAHDIFANIVSYFNGNISKIFDFFY